MISILLFLAGAACALEIWNFDVRDIAPPGAVSIARAIDCDREGNVWVGLSSPYRPGFVAKWDWNDITIYPMPSEDIEGLLVMPDDRILVLTHRRMMVFDVDTFVDFYPPISDDFSGRLCRAAVLDSSGNIWVTNWGYCLAKFDGIDWNYYPYPDSSYGHGDRHISLDHNNNLWFSTVSGFCRFSERDMIWDFISPEEVGFDTYLNMMADIEVEVDSTIWVASWRGGLNIVMDSLTLNYYWPVFASDTIPYTDEIFMDHLGNFWVSSAIVATTDNVQLACFSDPYHYELFDTSDGLMMGGSQDIAEDIYGNIWTGDGTFGFSVINLDRISRTPIDAVVEVCSSDQKTLMSVIPNPFNSAVEIDFAIGPRQLDGETVTMSIHDIHGRNIQEIHRLPYVWQPGPSIPSGTYLVKLKVGRIEEEKKVVYLK